MKNGSLMICQSFQKHWKLKVSKDKKKQFEVIKTTDVIEVDVEYTGQWL